MGEKLVLSAKNICLLTVTVLMLYMVAYAGMRWRKVIERVETEAYESGRNDALGQGFDRISVTDPEYVRCSEILSYHRIYEKDLSNLRRELLTSINWDGLHQGENGALIQVNNQMNATISKLHIIESFINLLKSMESNKDMRRVSERVYFRVCALATSTLIDIETIKHQGKLVEQKSNIVLVDKVLGLYIGYVGEYSELVKNINARFKVPIFSQTPVESTTPEPFQR